MQNRAIRRQQDKRRKAQCAKILKEREPHCTCIHDKKTVGKMSTIRGKCSCPMCGNPRKYFHEETKQEKIASLSQKDEG